MREFYINCAKFLVYLGCSLGMTGLVIALISGIFDLDSEFNFFRDDNDIYGRTLRLIVFLSGHLIVAYSLVTIGMYWYRNLMGLDFFVKGLFR